MKSEDQTDRFRDVILPHMDAAYNFARFLVRDAVAAEDIAQDAFLRAFRSLETWRGEFAKAWLLAIVRNCFLDWTKTHRGERWMAEAAEEDADEAVRSDRADDSDPETLLLRQRDMELIRNTLERLPEPFREVLILRELEELSYKEISSLIGAPIGTVMSRLARARRMFGALLSAHEPQGANRS